MLRNIFKQIPNKRFIYLLSRVWAGSASAPVYTEDQLITLLKSKFPEAKTIDVKDVSGGCGAMYEILVEDNKFKGISIIKQHRMITETLKNEIRDMHGIRIQTGVPDDSK